MGRGASLVFGKISLASDGESLEKLISYLGSIISKFGYPEKKVEENEETKEDIKEIIKNASPAKDSIVSLGEIKIKEKEKEQEEPEEEIDEEFIDDGENAEVDDFHPDDEA